MERHKESRGRQDRPGSTAMASLGRTRSRAGMILFALSRRRGDAMNPNKDLWEKGDFTEIASFMRESGAALDGSLGITVPLHVLDLACGDGTTALPVAPMVAEGDGIALARDPVAASKTR